MSAWEAFVCGIAETAGANAKIVNKIALVVEEVFINIAHYAYGGKPGEATIECQVNNNFISIRFYDCGTPYNPIERADPDLTLSLEEKQIGGLGILLTKKFMDNVAYEYSDGRNILTMKKRLE